MFVSGERLNEVPFGLWQLQEDVYIHLCVLCACVCVRACVRVCVCMCAEKIRRWRNS